MTLQRRPPLCRRSGRESPASALLDARTGAEAAEEVNGVAEPPPDSCLEKPMSRGRSASGLAFH